MPRRGRCWATPARGWSRWAARNPEQEGDPQLQPPSIRLPWTRPSCLEILNLSVSGRGRRKLMSVVHNVESIADLPVVMNGTET